MFWLTKTTLIHVHVESESVNVDIHYLKPEGALLSPLVSVDPHHLGEPGQKISQDIRHGVQGLGRRVYRHD